MAQQVMVGMSGGVDSSVAALLLQRQGWQVTGVTLRLRGGRLREQGGEDAEKDIQDAARVCAALGIAALATRKRGGLVSALGVRP